jgi:hypothetical protein
MNNKFDELTKSLAQSVTRRARVKKFGVGMALACLAMSTAAWAQTSLVCDAAGDAAIGNGRANGSPVPAWFDINQAVVTAGSSGNILFVLTMNGPVPTVPTWSKIDEGGQLTWGWRLIGDLADLTFVANGCLGGNGTPLPACYYLDLVWSVQTASFQARLLDNTSCTQVAIPFAFSADRTQITFLVAKSLLANQSLIPDADNFQYLAATVAWNSNSMSNNSYHNIDLAPDKNNGQLVLCSWSASSDYECFCP